MSSSFRQRGTAGIVLTLNLYVLVERDRLDDGPHPFVKGRPVAHDDERIYDVYESHAEVSADVVDRTVVLVAGAIHRVRPSARAIGSWAGTR